MNILLLTREYKHPDLPACGGTGSFMASLAKQLVKEGHLVHVLGINKVNADFADEGVFVHCHKNLFRRNALANFWRSFTKKALFLRGFHNRIHAYEKRDIAQILDTFIQNQNIQFDLIETHDFEGISLYFNDRIPYAIRCHGSFSVLEKYFGYEVEEGKKYCEREAFKKAKNIISVSGFSENINRELFGITEFRRIYNGIDTRLFKRDETAQLIPQSVFYFGTLAYEKGADTAVEILIELSKKFPKSQLHFVGAENKAHKQALEKTIAQNQLTEQVHFHGMQKTDTLIPLLSRAQILIFPSKGETFGLALCEAMALSKVVVASEIPSFREIVVNGKNGFIALSVDEYCKAIELVFNDPVASAKMANEARETIVEKFSQQKMLVETLAYYKEITGK